MADIHRIGLDEVARHFKQLEDRARPSIDSILWSVWSSSLGWQCSPVPMVQRRLPSGRR